MAGSSGGQVMPQAAPKYISTDPNAGSSQAPSKYLSTDPNAGAGTGVSGSWQDAPLAERALGAAQQGLDKLGTLGTPLINKGQQTLTRGNQEADAGSSVPIPGLGMSVPMPAAERSVGYGEQAIGAGMNTMGGAAAQLPHMLAHPIDSLMQMPAFVGHTVSALAHPDTWKNPQLLGSALANAIMLERMGEGTVGAAKGGVGVVKTAAELGKQAQRDGLITALKINADTRARGYMGSIKDQLIKTQEAAKADALQHMRPALAADKADIMSRGGKGAIDKGNVEASLNAGFDKIGEKGGRLSVAAQNELLKFRPDMTMQEALDLRTNLSNLAVKAKHGPDSVPLTMAIKSLNEAIESRAGELGQKGNFAKYNESFTKLYDNKANWMDDLINADDPYSFRDTLKSKQWGTIHRALGEASRKYGFDLDSYANSRDGLMRDAAYADPKKGGVSYEGTFRALSSHPLIATAAYVGAGAAGLPFVVRWLMTGGSPLVSESFEQARLGVPKAPAEWGPRPEPPPTGGGQTDVTGGPTTRGEIQRGVSQLQPETSEEARSRHYMSAQIARAKKAKGKASE